MSRLTRLRPVQSIKHIVDVQGGLLVNTTVVNTLVNVVDTPSVGTTNGVLAGSSVNSIFLNVQVAATSTAALANVYMAVYKNPGGNIATVDPQIVGGNDNKRYVIHQEMLMTEKNTTAIPRTLFKGVIRLPRGMKRFTYGDKLEITLKSPGTTYDFCYQTIYKEFR